MKTKDEYLTTEDINDLINSKGENGRIKSTDLLKELSSGENKK